MSHTNRTDSELIAACLKGDVSAWDALVRRYQGFIFAIALRGGLSQADAEDVFQNVCVRLYKYLGELRDINRLASWLAVTTRHELWAWRQGRGVTLWSDMAGREWEFETGTSVGGTETPDPETALLAMEREHLVRQGLQNLAEPCRKLLTSLYSDTDERSYAETAAKLSLPVGSIGPRRARCLQHLKKWLEKVGF